MMLSNNEKKVLKLLLKNPKISDSTMALKLKISSRAVGKIRRKLEKTVIDSYTLNLNYSKLGIHTFAIALALSASTINSTCPQSRQIFVLRGAPVVRIVTNLASLGRE